MKTHFESKWKIAAPLKTDKMFDLQEIELYKFLKKNIDQYLCLAWSHSLFILMLRIYQQTKVNLNLIPTRLAKTTWKVNFQLIFCQWFVSIPLLKIVEIVKNIAIFIIWQSLQPGLHRMNPQLMIEPLHRRNPH
jgi:hypothetical protein